jgi:hypothetical protein
MPMVNSNLLIVIFTFHIYIHKHSFTTYHIFMSLMMGGVPIQNVGHFKTP